ncbi:MAG: cell envelope biogenesis protein OmpA [Citrobacter sp.]|uniref:cell envelope biogenesis protein OmpA n=1 Tax=Citrobacter sp. TaxID=1896336 RepID=UPI002FC67A41
MNKLFQAAIGMALVTMSASSFAEAIANYPDIPATIAGTTHSYVDWNPGEGTASPHNDPQHAVGLPDDYSTALGRSGEIVLSTAPSILTGDTTAAADFYVYEGAEYESWDTYVSKDNLTWVKLDSVWNDSNSQGTVKGYDVDSITSGGEFTYIKIIDTSNSAGSTSSGTDVDGIALASVKYSGTGQIVDTDSRNGVVYDLFKDGASGAVAVKKISKDGSVEYIPFSTDDSLEPIALSVQGDFDCDDAKDINVLATRKSDGVQLNIIKDQMGSDIATIDNSVTK